MTFVTTPLMLSAAGMRLCGYFIETNLRVAQEFGRAAFQNNPFVVGVRVKPSVSATPPAAAAPRVKAQPNTPARARSKVSPPAQRKAPRPAPAAGAPAKVKAEAKAETRPAPAPAVDADQSKRPRAPSKPPAMPASKSAAMTDAPGSDQT
ncbi:hypothetical protein [Roseovarius sp.]|uniref:hypothetical protein n=1 Tax=Roseovarius sp. TaxID=1486281 RepID=UPI003562A52A